MPPIRRAACVGAVVAAVGALGVFGLGAAGAKSDEVELKLDPSSDQLAACMPKASLKVEVELTTDRVGFDEFEIRARQLPPNRSFTVFLLQTAASPFGAAEYIGDFTTNKHGNAKNEFRLIVARRSPPRWSTGSACALTSIASASGLPIPRTTTSAGNGQGGVTPFDGDNEAGVQAFNSRNADPLPAP